MDLHTTQASLALLGERFGVGRGVWTLTGKEGILFGALGRFLKVSAACARRLRKVRKSE